LRQDYSKRLEKKEFRMKIINQIVSLTPDQRARKIDEIITTYECSGRKLSRSTIYRWLKEIHECEDLGTALLPKERSDKLTYKVISQVQKDALIVWRSQNPYRPIKDLIEELNEHPETNIYPIPSEPTVARFLREQNLSRKILVSSLKVQKTIRLAFEAQYPQQLWMADTKGPNIMVVDPVNPDNLVEAKPVAIIDDNSRYLVAVKYVIVENEYVIMNLFCQAVEIFGVPEIFYVDRGSPYSGNSLKRASALIGCTVMHTRRMDPSAKGKVEKVLQTVHQRFETEMLVSGKAPSLDVYNAYLDAYIGQDYNKNRHSSTDMTPEEKYMQFPPQSRRWVTKRSLSLIFMPCKNVKISKTGLIRINKHKYLVKNSTLWGKKVTVRYEYLDKTKVYVWSDDKYNGESDLYTEDNDYLKRTAILESLTQPQSVSLPDVSKVPVYSRLERLFIKHRQEMESMDINEQIDFVKQKKQQVRAEILKNSSHSHEQIVPQSSVFEVEDFTFLLMRLLRRKFTPSERLLIHTFWHSVVSVDEKLVRDVVGKLLGQEHPTDDLKGYLEEIKLHAVTKKG
jgi:transposase InsO family protein